MAFNRSRRAGTSPVETPSGRARPRAIVVGGGVAALEALLALEELCGNRLDLVLVSSERRFTYNPLSIAEAFGGGRAYRLDLADLLDGHAVHVIEDRLESIDPVARRLRLAGGWVLTYDAALIAIGAHRRGVVPGAITFAGGKAVSELEGLMRAAKRGRLGRVAVAVPETVTWTLPAYELALLTAARFEEDAVKAEVALVTAEPRPVDLFGDGPSEAVGELLEARGVELHTVPPVRYESGRLVVKRGPAIEADAVLALPEPVAPVIPGMPRDGRGFMPVDDRCRAVGLERLYGAGDITGSRLKQGGIAAQQADVAAEAMLADLDLGPEPEPLRPALRALLLAGPPPRFRRLEVGRPEVTPHGPDEDEKAPPAKVAGRRLAPFLAAQGVPPGAPPGMFAVELEESAGGSAPERSAPA